MEYASRDLTIGTLQRGVLIWRWRVRSHGQVAEFDAPADATTGELFKLAKRALAANTEK